MGFVVGSVLKVDLAEAVKGGKVNFRFWIESYAWRLSLCFRSLYIAAILWKYTQNFPG